MIILDTCILLDLAGGVPLPTSIRTALAAEPWAVSAATAWEIGIKHASGKLPLLQGGPADWWNLTIPHFRLTVLPISDQIALRAAALPLLHADPFDRAILATALERNVTLASRDGQFPRYVKPCGLRLVAA